MCFSHNPSRGGEDSECVNPAGEGKESVCAIPTGGGNDSMCTAPTGEGKDSVCTVSGYIQASSVQECIYSRESKRSASGGQTKAVPSEWEKHGSHWLITGLIRDGYKLPFGEHPTLSRYPA